MHSKDYYTLQEVSEICSLETEFIKALAQSGIIQIYRKARSECIPLDEIELLNMARRLHFDLGINKEGIGVILSMRQKIIQLQEEVQDLERKVIHLQDDNKFRNLEIIINS